MDAYVERVEQTMEAVAEIQDEAITRLGTNIEDTAKLYVDGLSYFGRLQEQWRTIVLQSARSASTGASS